MASKQYDIRRSKMTTTRDSSTGAYTRTSSIETPPSGNTRSSTWKPGHGAISIDITGNNLHKEAETKTKTLDGDMSYTHYTSSEGFSEQTPYETETYSGHSSGKTWIVPTDSPIVALIGCYGEEDVFSDDGLAVRIELESDPEYAWDNYSFVERITQYTPIDETAATAYAYKFACGSDYAYLYYKTVNNVSRMLIDFPNGYSWNSVYLYKWREDDASPSYGAHSLKYASNYNGEAWVTHNKAVAEALAMSTITINGVEVEYEKTTATDGGVTYTPSGYLTNNNSVTFNDTSTITFAPKFVISSDYVYLQVRFCMHSDSWVTPTLDTHITVAGESYNPFTMTVEAPGRLIPHTDTDLGDTNVTHTVLKALAQRTTKFDDEMMDGEGFIGTGASYTKTAHTNMAKFSDANATTTQTTPEDTTSYKITKKS